VERVLLVIAFELKDPCKTGDNLEVDPSVTPSASGRVIQVSSLRDTVVLTTSSRVTFVLSIIERRFISPRQR
jgi:hypothetical protein